MTPNLRLFMVCSVIVLLISHASADAATWRFASPQTRLFRPLLADPTETRFGFYPYLNKNRLGGDIGRSTYPGMIHSKPVCDSDCTPVCLPCSVKMG